MLVVVLPKGNSLSATFQASLHGTLSLGFNDCTLNTLNGGAQDFF
jgi:hypothetical protein